MPAELPAEINRQVNKAIILLSQTSNPSDITIIVKQLVLAAIPIVARIDAEIAEQQRLQAEHEIECTEGIEYSQAQWRGSEIAARIIKQAILSRWKMED